jgi:hypothetical protein
MLTTQISKMRSLLIVRQSCPESADAHVGPVGTAHKLTIRISRKWTIDV